MRVTLKYILDGRHMLMALCFFLFSPALSQNLPPCIPPIPFNAGNDTTVTCGTSMEIGEIVEGEEEEPDFELAPTCEKTSMSQNGPLTQGGGIYNNGVVTTGGTANINNTNTLIDVTNTDPMGPNAWQTLWYSDFTNHFVEVCPGNSFDITINAKSLYSNSPYFCQIWVDWDNDGQFTASEVVHNSGPYSTNNFTVNGTITVPAGQVDGAFRMRIRFKDNAPFVPTDNADGCTFGNPVGIPPGYAGYSGNNYGYYYFSDEVEDYTVKVDCGNGNSNIGDVSYAWSPAEGLSDPTISNPIATPTETTTYTVTITDTENDCISTYQITVEVDGQIIPEFTNPGPVCIGQNFTLPTLSNNGINGSWSPAVNTNETTEYTFTPDATEGCAEITTLTVEVSNGVTPTFTNPGPICDGQTFTLPTISDNGINGSWSPAINSNETTEYTFTPDAAEECAESTTLTVEVATEVIPTFTNPGPICTGEFFTLPEVSINGIDGTWSPTINNTTTEYTFTPNDLDGCATETTMTIEVLEIATPEFTEINAMCEGDNFTLPTVSNNNINGMWSPAINNLQTTTYTFTPSSNVACAEPTTMTIEINQAPDTPNVSTTPADCDNASVSTINNYNPSNDYIFDPPGPTVGESGVVLGMNEGVSYTVAGVEGDCQSGKTDPFSLSIIGTPNAVFNGTASGCLPVNVQFQNGSIGGITYLWDFGDGHTSTSANPSHVYTQEGCFDVTLTVANEEGCESTSTITEYVCTYASPVAAFSTSTEVIENINEEVQFTNHSTGANSYQWTFGDGDSSQDTHPNHSYEGNYPGNYSVILIASNEAGCTDTAKTFIEVPENITFYIPNSFTPDGDMNNPVFLPIFSPDMIVNEFEFHIYNRWGELVFESYDPLVGWDGSYMRKEPTMCMDGVYIWKMQIKMITTDKVIYNTGHVTLIR